MTTGYNDEERALAAQGEAAKNKAAKMYTERGRKIPLLDRMVFAKEARCLCGAGMAYDPFGEPTPPFKIASEWKCSSVILGTADAPFGHDTYSFTMYNIKAERDGESTRP